MNLKKWKGGKVFTSKFVETGPLSYEKRIYRAAVSQRLRNADLDGFPEPHLRGALSKSHSLIIFLYYGIL